MKSSLKGLILAFIATLTIYSLVRSNISKKIPISLRFLVGKSSNNLINGMCSRASDLDVFYRTTGPDYYFKPKSENGLLTAFIKNYISDKSDQKIGAKDIENYFKDQAVYIFITILIIILMFCHFPYCICMICNCFPCIPKSCVKSPKHLVIGCIALCVPVLICCFVGYTKNGKIVKGIYGIGCSFLKVGQHLIEGDEYNSKIPYWTGLRNIAGKLQEIINNITSLPEKTEIIKNQLQNDINPLFVNFSSDLNDEYNTRIKETVSNPDPNNSTEISPLYLKIYGPPDQEFTPLNFIGEEITLFNNYSFKAINSILNTLNVASDYKDHVKEKIDQLKDILDTNINDIFNSIDQKVAASDLLFDQIDSFSISSLTFLFSLDIIIIVAVLISLLCLLVQKKGLGCLCCSWCLLYSLMISALFMSVFFGLLGSFAQDASIGINHLINNLDEIDDMNDKVKDFAQICIKGNGSLVQSKIIPSGFNLSIIDNVYGLENVIDEGIDLIKDYNLISITKNEKLYDNILTSKYNISEIIIPLKDAQKYTDSSLGDNSYVKENSKFMDKWEINKNECGEYSYSPVTTILNNLFEEDSKLCLVITEWSREQIKNRYKSIEAKSEETNILEEILNYYDSIMGFLLSNKEIISKIKDKNEDFNKTFHNIKLAEIKVLSNTKDIITPFREGIKGIVGDESIFEILNCKFLRRDVNKIMEIIYDAFGGTFKSISTIYYIMAIFELIITIFIMLIMKAYSIQKPITDTNQYIEMINNEFK